MPVAASHIAERRRVCQESYARTAPTAVGASHVRWEGYIFLALEIRIVVADSIRITRRLKAALEDLLSATPPDRRPPP